MVYMVDYYIDSLGFYSLKIKFESSGVDDKKKKMMKEVVIDDKSRRVNIFLWKRQADTLYSVIVNFIL
ncbi:MULTISPECIES: hypothetical protein [unclassified Clostridioides]|uniref:hypothetical protein n=1 Tax=unclassified Clostridioides TaxID=2635829 RepID=UPI001D1174E9|nr:hypothetical protein [Clostridioides sp. ES-S-0171-01]MCC0688224.1 hypothetical protein [Clostridioides sp. ES-S-0056-01]MCC0715866.1 hypothetical protein [Clostridioides sp. ES-S-0077-01]UDN54301.1 hypothetical protein JJC02_15705 [Clostridioides sp. ES-S-0054-01]